MAEKNKCIVCGSRTVNPFYEGILKCAECGHVYADLDLSDEELFAFYSEKYFCGEEYRDYVEDKRIIQKNFALRYEELKPFLDPQRHRRLFEIGSAYGFFLDLVRDDFDVVRGIDITPEGPRYAREKLGLDVAQGDFLNHPLDDETFDVVCMWDTIEHLRSPQLYVEKVSAHTRPGAVLAITTGDIESLNSRFRKERWRLIHPPTHAHYFSKDSMAQMLDNYGFETVHNGYCGFYRSVESAAHNILVLRQGRQKLFDTLQRSKLVNFDLYSNLYDIMYVIARKR